MKKLDELMSDGWFVKIASKENQWQCWLSWRGGDPPHKEAFAIHPNLSAVVKWFDETVINWNMFN